MEVIRAHPQLHTCGKCEDFACECYYDILSTNTSDSSHFNNVIKAVEKQGSVLPAAEITRDLPCLLSLVFLESTHVPVCPSVSPSVSVSQRTQTVKLQESLGVYVYANTSPPSFSPFYFRPFIA